MASCAIAPRSCVLTERSSPRWNDISSRWEARSGADWEGPAGRRLPEPMDIVDKATRSGTMASVGQRDTAPEMKLRRELHRMGFRYRLHQRKLPGSPGLVFPTRGPVRRRLLPSQVSCALTMAQRAFPGRRSYRLDSPTAHSARDDSLLPVVLERQTFPDFAIRPQPTTQRATEKGTLTYPRRGQ